MCRQTAAWCIQHLTQGSPDAREALREAGALPLLVAVLDGAWPASAQERATWALCNLATDCTANRIAIRWGCYTTQTFSP